MVSIELEEETVPTARRTVLLDLSDLEQNAKVRKAARKELPKLIVAARVDGWSWPAIAEAADLSLQATRNIAREGNNGVLPKPRQS